MPTVRSLLFAAAACLPLPAQDRVPLAHATGTLAHLPGWTVLAAAELGTAARPSDPADEPARTFLQSVVGMVRERHREQDHVVLHARGAAPGGLRIVNAYSADVRATGKQLAAAESLGALQKAFAEQLAQPDTTVESGENGPCALWPANGVMLHFRVASADLRWHIGYYIVPAGDTIQYFETLRMAGDDDARGAIEALLATFDGAKDPAEKSSALLIGALAGGLGGMAAAVFTRRRRERTAAGDQPASG